MMMCMYCAMIAFVQNEGKDVPHPNDTTSFGVFPESPSEHMTLHHPNGIDPEEHAQWMAKADGIVRRIRQRAYEQAENARNN
jgi:hypothetical protein